MSILEPITIMVYFVWLCFAIFSSEIDWLNAAYTFAIRSTDTPTVQLGSFIIFRRSLKLVPWPDGIANELLNLLGPHVSRISRVAKSHWLAKRRIPHITDPTGDQYVENVTHVSRKPNSDGAWESPTRRSTCLTNYFPGFRVLKFANRRMRLFTADRQGQDKKIPSNAFLVPIPIASWRWTLFSAQNLDYSNCEKQFSHCVQMRPLGSSPVSFTKQVDVMTKLLGIDRISDMSFEAHVQRI
jgi:hypothetical protein